MRSTRRIVPALQPRPRSLSPSLPLALVLLVAAGALLAFAFHTDADAATPAGGTLDATHRTLTWTGSISGAGSGEATCVDGVSCDSFQVVLAPGDYTGQQVMVQITWSVLAYDYDLYVHLNTLRGPVFAATNGPPGNTEEHVFLSVSPGVVTSPITWWAHPQAASVPPGMTYTGTASIIPLPGAVSVTHLAGSLPFSRTVPLFAPSTVRDLEPSVRVDVRGNCYVGAIRGVPAGVDMWRFDLNPSSPTYDPEMRNAVYLGKPDAFSEAAMADSLSGGADGGGDIEIATSVPADPNETPVVTMVSLALANTSSHVSTDRGATWTHNPGASPVPSEDRQWIEAYGPNNVYLVVRGPVPSTTLYSQTSTDHGVTWGAPVPIVNTVNPTDLTTPGYITVDPNDGTVYVSHQNDGALYVSRSSDEGASWTTVLVDNATGHGHLFDPIKVGGDGTVYAVWSNARHILYAYSRDHGTTWTAPSILSDPNATRTNVFPWLAAGTAGRLGVVWYGSTSDNLSAADWHVYFAQSLDANTATPTFRQQQITDHVIHGSNISEGGLTGAANRNLGDYFQIAYDPQGAAVVAFADDHNDFDGNTYVVRQLAGPGLVASANGGTGIVSSVTPTAPAPVDFGWPEVVDPAHDAVARAQPIPSDNPFDITSITYFADNDGPDAPYIGARMALSGLTTATPGNWRIAFTANAPFGSNWYPDGVSDHGDMFYLLASDTSGATPKFTFGTAYRDSEPLVPVVFAAFAMAYNAPAGTAVGSIDTTTSTVTVKASIAKLNALLPPGHAPIAAGTWLAGLRGSAGSIQTGVNDNTRGGRFNYLVNFTGWLSAPGPAAAEFAVSAWPNPARGGGTTVRFAVPQAGRAALAVFDVAGRRVRTLLDGPVAAGARSVAWNGRTDSGTPAGEGVYFVRLEAGGRSAVSRIVALR